MTKSKSNKKQGGKQKESKKPVKKVSSISIQPWALACLGGIMLVTSLCYWPALQNEFVWDDIVYIQKNPLIYSLDLQKIFSSYLAGNYHPLTVWVHALEYHFFAFKPGGYHAVNIFIHLLNTLLVFFFIRRLSKNEWIGLVTALLFGIHPLHVESVAWVSELKDLLYTFFFLGSLITYLRFGENRRMGWYLVSLLLFILSLLSKGMAVSLPLVLVLIDFLQGRWKERKVWLEKIPYFILSVVFGIIALIAQQSVEALHGDVIPWLHRIVFACYGYITYLQKLVVPYPLNAYYPYPVGPDEAIPPFYFLYVILTLLLVTGTWFSLRKGKKIFWGVGFFTVTVFLVLKLVVVGFAVMADRYSYVPSIGIFYLAGEGIWWLYKNKSAIVKPITVGILAIFTILFGYTTFQRSKVWKNNYTLWTDTIEKDNTNHLAYLNRGVYWLENKRFDEAETDLNKALQLNPEYPDANYNRGLVYQNTQRIDNALTEYNKAIAGNPSMVKAYVNRANIYRDRNQNDLSLTDYNKAIELDPGVFEAYNNKGILLQNQGKYQEAHHEFSRAIEINPGYVNAFINRGNMNIQLKRMNDAMLDYNQAIAINPNSGLAFYARGLLEVNLSQLQKACEDFQMASNLGIAQAGDAHKQYCK